MKTHVIQVDAFDDVHSIKDKMNWSNSARILLVIPDQAHSCKRKLDLVLLLRHASQLGAQLGLVTDNVQIEQISHKLGIPVFTNSSIAQRRTWRPQKKVPFCNRPEKARLSFPEQEHKKDKKPQERITQKSWFRIGLFCSAILANLLMAFIFLPRADVNIFMKEKIISIELEVVANPDIPTPSLAGEFPVKELTIMLTKSMNDSSSGTIQVADGYAKGFVDVTNLTDNALIIPAGTIFMSSMDPERQFVTEQEIELSPGAGSVRSIPVRAVAPGEEGNTPANELTVAVGAISGQISINNALPVSGGTDMIMPAPTRQDVERVRAEILDELSQVAFESITSSLKSDEYPLECSLAVKEIPSESSFPEEGQPAGQFSVSMEVVYSMLVYEDPSIRQLGDMVLDANIPDGWKVKPDSFYFEIPSQPEKDETGKITWVIRVAEIIQPEGNIDQLTNELTSLVRADAVLYLESHLDLREPIQISMWPSFWPWMPVLPAQIHIQVK